MTILDHIAVFVGFAVSRVSVMLRLGAGATWPGEIALRISPGILSALARRCRHGVVLVAGTNGKTTTARMLRTILESAGHRVIHNESGANLLNGVVSAFLAPSAFVGKRPSYGIFEVDENALPQVLAHITPKAIVLLNLFRDQLDRYGEVDAIAERWKNAISDASQKGVVVADADDAQIVETASHAHGKVVWFGLEDASLFIPAMEHATDTVYCPRCANRLTFGGVYYSHLGKWACGRCDLLHPTPDVTAKDYQSPVAGVYNKYNTIAAALSAEVLGFDRETVRRGLLEFTPAFGRMELIMSEGKPIRMLLSKNPTGFNESIRAVFASDEHGPIVILLNDRIPDGRDVSWIWDTDFERIASFTGTVFVSGDRAYDMAVRLKYAGVPTATMTVMPRYEDALAAARAEARVGETVRVLPTYSAMLDARGFLTGRRIL